jgi:hypothetical protein
LRAAFRAGGCVGNVGLSAVVLENSIRMVGILVHGNDHFILSGPRPTEVDALALVRHWSVIRIGEPPSMALQKWQIRSKEFRENLEWAVIVPGDRDISPGVAKLLEELTARNIRIDRCRQNCW